MTTCTPAIAVTVYDGLDNRFKLAIEDEDGTLMTSLAGLTRVTIVVGSSTVDSDVVGSSVIWWTDTASFRGSDVPVITFELGGQSLTVGEHTDCELTIYDGTYTGGLRIANPIKVTVE